MKALTLYKNKNYVHKICSSEARLQLISPSIQQTKESIRIIIPQIHSHIKTLFPRVTSRFLTDDGAARLCRSVLTVSA